MGIEKERVHINIVCVVSAWQKKIFIFSLEAGLEHDCSAKNAWVNKNQLEASNNLNAAVTKPRIKLNSPAQQKKSSGRAHFRYLLQEYFWPLGSLVQTRLEIVARTRQCPWIGKLSRNSLKDNNVRCVARRVKNLVKEITLYKKLTLAKKYIYRTFWSLLLPSSAKIKMRMSNSVLSGICTRCVINHTSTEFQSVTVVSRVF